MLRLLCHAGLLNNAASAASWGTSSWAAAAAAHGMQLHGTATARQCIRSTSTWHHHVAHMLDNSGSCSINNDGYYQGPCHDDVGLPHAGADGAAVRTGIVGNKNTSHHSASSSAINSANNRVSSSSISDHSSASSSSSSSTAVSWLGSPAGHQGYCSWCHGYAASALLPASTTAHLYQRSKRWFQLLGSHFIRPHSIRSHSTNTQPVGKKAGKGDKGSDRPGQQHVKVERAGASSKEGSGKAVHVQLAYVGMYRIKRCG